MKSNKSTKNLDKILEKILKLWGFCQQVSPNQQLHHLLEMHSCK
jgi:hypothetical protein